MEPPKIEIPQGIDKDTPRGKILTSIEEIGRRADQEISRVDSQFTDFVAEKPALKKPAEAVLAASTMWEKYLSHQREIEDKMAQLQDQYEAARAGSKAFGNTSAKPNLQEVDQKRTAALYQEVLDFKTANVPSEMYDLYKIPPELRDKPLAQEYMAKVEEWKKFAMAERERMQKNRDDDKLPEPTKDELARAREEARAQKERADDLARRLEESERARELAENRLVMEKRVRLEAEQELAREEQRADELAQQLGEAKLLALARATPMSEEVDKSLPSARLYAESPTPPEGSPENLRTTNDRRTERFLWWFSVAVGGSAGLVMEATGGWWINPIARAVITGVGAGAGVADLWIGWRERRVGADELQKRLRDYQKAARYLRIVAGGIGTGIAAVSLSTMAIHAASEGIGALTQAVTDRFTQTAQEQTQEKIAQWVGKEAATTDWLSRLDVRGGGSAWGTVHDLINNHQIPGVELWQTPTGNNSADVIAQWSTEIFPHFNHSAVDIIQPGTLDLAQHLQPDQVEFLGQLANTKDYNQYLALVKEFAKTHPDIAQVPEVARVLVRK